MRLIKMLGLAMVAAIAAMAFVGASSASAKVPLLTACKTNEKLCSAANLIGVLINAKATNPVLLGTLNQECASSKSMATEESATETSILGVVDELTFEGCKPCTTITTSPPYKASISGSTLTSGGSATFSGCPFGINCKFGASKIELSLAKNESGLYDKIIADKEPLSLESGSALFCGSTGQWDATYLIETPFHFAPERHS